MKLNDLELLYEIRKHRAISPMTRRSRSSDPWSDEDRPTDLSDQQIAQIVHHMDELIVDQHADNPTEAAHEALDQIAGFEQGIVEPQVRARLVARLVDLYDRMYSSG